MQVQFKCLLASALAASVVNGHGYMTDPKVTFTAQAGDPTQYIATIESTASGLSGTFNGAPKDNVAAYTKAFGASKYTSLKEFVTDKAKISVTGATLTCGSCDPKEAAQPMPKATMEWSHSDSEGFTASHEGPCEVWCDDVRTFQDDNCPAKFTTAPAQLPFDRDACMGASTLTFYWMAMHSSTWQVYVNCAPLAKTTSSGATSKFAVGSSTSTAQSNSTSSASADTPSTSTTTEAPTTTEASSSGSSTSQTTTAPSTPSQTTAPSTPSETTAPSTPSATTAPSTPLATTAPTTDASDCGSYDVAGGSASDCGSYDVAGGSASDCGSFDVAGSKSDCGSFDVAGSGDATQGAGSQTNFDFSTVQGTTSVGTVSPYN
ncbi:hypothetical protein PHYPSEUDO_011992 [Phytophthora pseudosyringae]|uniref:Uncharacterized protein n=1 Tax=Phytophthora pseudosyringae TaxID=221518 RepID=A0A8T1W5K3_9STRA|nr:hypothetical protein PHYPSEUDO_011992 [Phytophthora pseudosyringae]